MMKQSTRKDKREYQPVKVTPYLVGLYMRSRLVEECHHPDYYQENSDECTRCIYCHTIVDPDEVDWKFEDDPDAH